MKGYLFYYQKKEKRKHHCRQIWDFNLSPDLNEKVSNKEKCQKRGEESWSQRECGQCYQDDNSHPQLAPSVNFQHFYTFTSVATDPSPLLSQYTRFSPPLHLTLASISIISPLAPSQSDPPIWFMSFWDWPFISSNTAHFFHQKKISIWTHLPQHYHNIVWFARKTN